MKVYKLENLHCAQCAATIEKTLGDLAGVSAVRVQFATSELHIETSNLDQVKQTIDQVEPGVKVVEPQDAPSVPARWPQWATLLVATVLWAGLLVAQAWVGTNLGLDLAFAALYLVAGWTVLKTATLHLVRGQVFDENFLMAVATLAAWVVGAGAESVSVMIFYQWGEWLQDRSVERSRNSLGALLASRPRTVRLVTDGGIQEVDPTSVPSGAVFEVRAGEMVPLDGVVLDGVGSVDTSALTGESLPRGVAPGTEVAAGSVNLDSVWRLRSLRPFHETAWAGIVTSVDQALASKAPLERFLTRFARTYTPLVLVLALGVFGLLSALGMPWHDSLYRSLVLLVISCPCALVVSVPLTYLGAIGAASRQGLLIRDAGALDRLASVTAAAFDKTGTLTEGRPRVKALHPVGSEEALRSCLDAGFAASSHPLARAWGTAASAPPGVVETRGQGVTFSWGGGTAAMGRRTFLAQQGFAGVPAGDDEVTTVHAAGPSGYLGRVDFEDPPKDEAGSAVAELRTLGLKPLALVSGDAPRVVEDRAREWDLEPHGGLLPEDKRKLVEGWVAQGHRVLFVGDGLNDAPVLAQASVGVSLGAGASAAAIETADIAVLDPSPRHIGRLIRLGRRTKALLWQNITLALGLKVLFMVLGGLGLAGLWEAVFADVGVALLAVANSLRASRALS